MEVGLTGCVSPKLEKQRQEVKSIEVSSVGGLGKGSRGMSSSWTPGL